MVALTVKIPPAMRQTWAQFLGRERPLEEGMAIHSSVLPREFHGQRSLAGYSPASCKESDVTEHINPRA